MTVKFTTFDWILVIESCLLDVSAHFIQIKWGEFRSRGVNSILVINSHNIFLLSFHFSMKNDNRAVRNEGWIRLWIFYWPFIKNTIVSTILHSSLTAHFLTYLFYFNKKERKERGKFSCHVVHTLRHTPTLLIDLVFI